MEGQMTLQCFSPKYEQSEVESIYLRSKSGTNWKIKEEITESIHMDKIFYQNVKDNIWN